MCVCVCVCVYVWLNSFNFSALWMFIKSEGIVQHSLPLGYFFPLNES